MNDNDLIKEVRSASNIVDVISSYLPLVKKGKNYFGVCPFHDDNNPSMSVSEDKQIYKCFSCGASGNVFNFVMDYEKIDFKSALYLLAKRSGINVSNNLVKTNNKNDKFYEIYNIAEKYYQNNLNTSLGLEAKSYLHNRGIDDELIKHFKIGLSLKELLFILPYGSLGYAFGYLYNKSDNIISTIVSHSIHNTIVFIIILTVA